MSRGTLIALLVVAVACSSSSEPPPASSEADSGEGPGIQDCPDDVPASCPQSAPTYAKDIAPIMKASCATAQCHAPGGREEKRPLTDYDKVFAQRQGVLLQVNACRMPPRDAPALALPAESRKALLAWLVCGAKND